MTEQRTFSMHPNLLRDVIERQAGTLDKAVLEGVMNLVEAKATKGDVLLTNGRLIIVDNGLGFATKEEVIAAFEVFGKSDERKAEDKRWAEFQMGRGQLFAFGRTTYRTRTFEMVVDIRDCSQGIGYSFREGLEDVAGCEITVDLYDPLSTFDLREIVKSVAKNCRYVEVPLSLNGEVISVDPRTESWTAETDDAFYRHNSGTAALTVYNLGVFVESVYGYGSGGVIVSKKRLKLNFARNQVIRACPVWRHITALFVERTERDLLAKRAFRGDDAWTVISRLRDGQYRWSEVANLRLLRDTRNKPVSLADFAKYTRYTTDKIRSLQADAAMASHGDMIVLERDHARTAFGTYDMGGLPRLIRAFLLEYAGVAGPDFVPMDEAYKGLDAKVTLLDQRDLGKAEAEALKALSSDFGQYAFGMLSDKGAQGREFRIGLGDGIRSWTDGARFIAIERSFLKSCMTDMSGWLTLVNVIAEQYAYRSSELSRDLEYYERYNEIVGLFAGRFGRSYRNLIRRLGAAGVALTNLKRDILAMDQHDGVDTLGSELEEDQGE